MRLAIHGREVRVPDLRGMTVLQAQETANGSGLLVSVEDKFYSSEVPEGKILSQAPPASSRVRRGWRVRVVESLGPQRVAIPSVIGETEHAATVNLRQRGLDLAIVSAIPVPGVPPDEVVAQVPAPGAAVLSPKMSILLADSPPLPEYVMPNLVGRPLAEVREKVARAGLQIASVTLAGSAVTSRPSILAPGTTAGVSPQLPRLGPNSGTVSAQSPPPGSRVTAETQIKLEVTQ
jgi:beta-lactam-binding protein with PASTA domain